MSSTVNRHLLQQEHNRNRAAASSQRWSSDGAKDGFNGANSSALGARAARPMMDAANERATAAAAESGSHPLSAMFKQLLAKSEARIASLFGLRKDRTEEEDVSTSEPAAAERDHAANMPSASAPKPPVRVIDEDDYDDYDDYEPDTSAGCKAAPSKDNANSGSGGPWPTPPSTKTGASSALSTDPRTASGAASAQTKSVEEVREQLQQDKKAAEAAAERSAYAVFYTLEHDRDAMLEQQKLDEADRQVDAEMSGHGGHGNAGTAASGASGPQYGKLSNANLGASSLALKHLIARIDAKRDKVKASDAQLRSLINEVRKNRSKWASEDRIGQEELYEAADKVLSELKAMTEHSQPFLTRVNKRDAPDYYTVIKSPMDLGTMTKKLKSLVYKSKQEFVNDLNTIWSNCLTYNADPNHFLRKHALAMKKETDKLVPLIPDIVIRDRSEVEAEERRQQNGGLDVDADGAEESDDEPIMSSRGRVGPKKGTNAVRKAPSAAVRNSPAPETRSSLHRLNSAASRPKAEHRRSDFDALSDGHPAGMSTPTLGGIGSLSPAGLNGYAPSTQLGSQADSSADADGFGAAPGPGHHHHLAAALDVDEDPEYKTWKQVTKRDRARVATERHRLFKDGGINKEEPALMRTRAGMRRWMRKHRRVFAENLGSDDYPSASTGLDAAARAAPGGDGGGGESLAEDIAGEDNDVSRMLPEYYDVANGVPDLPPQLQWVEDEDGQLRQPADQDLYIIPNGHFTAPNSVLTRKLDANMRQIQETRKVCAKIGIVKQMQLQSQLYQNQFSKYSPEPLVEKDISPAAMTDAGPVMAPQVCRAALQRSVAKIFYHAGFEEYQPTAIEAATDLAAEFFTSLVDKFCAYREDREVPFATSLASGEIEAAVTAAAAAKRSGAAGVGGDGHGKKRKRAAMEAGSTTAMAAAAMARGNGDDEEGDNGDGSANGSGGSRRLSRSHGTRRRKKQRRGDGDGVSGGGRNGAVTEEALLYALHQNGLDVEALESYVKDDVERLGSKASAMHSRMTGHLADLLRPAFNQSGSDGDAAFDDGSEQFVSGAFAEEFGLDYFALDDLGIAKELGLSSLSVPLHLLQNRIHNTYAAQNPSAAAESHISLEAPPRYPPVTLDNVGNEIGLVQNFFLAKLHANGDAPLIEDEDLPPKQRPSKPRLPPTGKITAPRKRPAKEQGGNKSKKRKVEKKDSTAGGGAAGGGAGGSGNGDAATIAAPVGASAASAMPGAAAPATAGTTATTTTATAAAAAPASASTSTSAKSKQAGGSKAKSSSAATAAAANNSSGEASLSAPTPAAAVPGARNDNADIVAAAAPAAGTGGGNLATAAAPPTGGGASDDSNSNENTATATTDTNTGVAAGSYNNSYSHAYSYGYGAGKEAPPSPMSSVSSPSAGNHIAHPLLPGGGVASG